MTTEAKIGKFARGYISDPPNHMVTSARRLIGLATPAPKASVNQFAPAIHDQGRKSQCTGEGSMGAFMTSCRAHNIILPFKDDASQAWAYKIGRAVDRESPNEPLEDIGAMPNQVVRAITEFGILGASDCSDKDEDVNEEPNVVQLKKASRVHALGWHSIFSSGKDLVLDIMRAIDIAKVAVPMSCDVDQAFEDYNGKGVIPVSIGGTNFGGHFVYLTEYQTNTAGKILLRFRNSWSENWGDKGTGWVDNDFIMRRLTSKFTASALIRGAT